MPVWQPVLLDPGDPDRADVERRAAEQGLPQLRWPAGWPGDGELAARAAVYAQASGRAVAFSLAAFRQEFGAGRDLDTEDNVLIAAAACELHPRALLQGVASRAVRERLERQTAEAVELGVRSVPAIAVGADVHAGPDAPERVRRAREH